MSDTTRKTAWTPGPWHVEKIQEGEYAVRCENQLKVPIVVVDHHRDGHDDGKVETQPREDALSLLAEAHQYAPHFLANRIYRCLHPEFFRSTPVGAPEESE